MSYYTFGPALSGVSLNGTPIYTYDVTIERMFLEALDESEFRAYSERNLRDVLLDILLLRECR